jgi:hypothetical protein
MSFIEEFKKQCPEEPGREWSTRERLALLKIGPAEADELSRIAFEVGDVEGYGTPQLEEVELSKITGVNREERAGNWLASLMSLHKQYNFDRFAGRDNFQKFLLDSASMDLPHLIAHGDGYLVGQNGKHRVTIAKCLGLNKIAALVSRKT